MKVTNRLTDQEYETLSLEYEQNPPILSGNPSFLTNFREKILITELLPPDCTRIVTMKAKALTVSPSKVIQLAIKHSL